MSNQNSSGRETSLAGLIGALIVTVACIIGFVMFREITRDVPETRPEAIDWKPVADAALREGHPIAVPEVPENWIVTNIRFEPTIKPTWDLAMLTDKEKFAGLFQSGERVETLVESHVDEDAEEGDPVTIPSGDLAGEWQTFTDDGGDFALVHQDVNGTVLIYGSAPRQQLIDMAGSLVVGTPKSPTQ